jgi:hypothetical protein
MEEMELTAQEATREKEGKVTQEESDVSDDSDGYNMEDEVEEFGSSSTSGTKANKDRKNELNVIEKCVPLAWLYTNRLTPEPRSSMQLSLTSCAQKLVANACSVSSDSFVPPSSNILFPFAVCLSG